MVLHAAALHGTHIHRFMGRIAWFPGSSDVSKQCLEPLCNSPAFRKPLRNPSKTNDCSIGIAVVVIIKKKAIVQSCDDPLLTRFHFFGLAICFASGLLC